MESDSNVDGKRKNCQRKVGVALKKKTRKPSVCLPLIMVNEIIIIIEDLAFDGNVHDAIRCHYPK